MTSHSVPGHAPRCLVVEDDPSILELVTVTLRSNGFEVETKADGEAAIERCREDPPDVILLDFELPGASGQHVCRVIRSFCDSYIVFVTGRSSEVDRVMSLTAGADDYVVKPFSPAELTARIHALLRRPRRLAEPPSPASGEAPLLTLGSDLQVNERTRRASVNDKELCLTAVEFQTLLVLARHCPDLVTRQQLTEEIWSAQSPNDRRIIDAHMHNLRKKLRDSGASVRIQTERGSGFRLLTTEE